MTQGLLALSDDTTDLARASLLLATSAAYYLAVRPFLRVKSLSHVCHQSTHEESQLTSLTQSVTLNLEAPESFIVCTLNAQQQLLKICH